MRRKPILPLLALLGVLAILFVTLVLPPLRNASIAKAVRRNLVARGYGDVEASLKDRHVFLWGRSKTAEERAAVEAIARNVPGVSGVNNHTGLEDDLAAAVATSGSLRTELGETLARLEDTSRQLDAMRERAKGAESSLEETRGTLARRTEDLAAFKAAWSRDKAELELALDTQKADNAALRETLANTEIVLAEARRVLAARDREYARESGELKQTLADLGAKLTSTETGLAQSEQAKMAATETAARLQSERDAATTRMAALESKRADTEKLLAEARRVLAVRDQEFVAQADMLAAAESALAALKRQLEEKPDASPDAPQLQAYPRQSFPSF